MLFETTETKFIERGTYIATTDVTTSGTAALSFSVDSLPAQNIENASWSASISKVIHLPECNLTVTLTGDAKFSLLRANP